MLVMMDCIELNVLYLMDLLHLETGNIGVKNTLNITEFLSRVRLERRIISLRVMLWSGIGIL